MSGRKTIETRGYALPENLLGLLANIWTECVLRNLELQTCRLQIGQKIWLLATEGEEGVATLGDAVPAGSNAARIVSK